MATPPAISREPNYQPAYAGRSPGLFALGLLLFYVPTAWAEPAVDFRNDIEPILTKTGCNAGGCHGKASGQNGFKLSLFAFEPKFDYDALVNEGHGRRVFPASPEESLLVQKATGSTVHGGRSRLDESSD